MVRTLQREASKKKWWAVLTVPNLILMVGIILYLGITLLVILYT
jgi:hypothetical protein